jgi:hypothetical protein
MRLPRVRFTVWRMMVAVAVVGGATWLGKMYRLARYYVALSNHYEMRLQLPSSAPAGVSDTAWLLAWERDRDLMYKYRRLAFNPWLPSPPTRPEPE